MDRFLLSITNAKHNHHDDNTDDPTRRCDVCNVRFRGVSCAFCMKFPNLINRNVNASSTARTTSASTPPLNIAHSECSGSPFQMEIPESTTPQQTFLAPDSPAVSRLSSPDMFEDFSLPSSTLSPVPLQMEIPESTTPQQTFLAPDSPAVSRLSSPDMFEDFSLPSSTLSPVPHSELPLTLPQNYSLHNDSESAVRAGLSLATPLIRVLSNVFDTVISSPVFHAQHKEQFADIVGDSWTLWKRTIRNGTDGGGSDNNAETVDPANRTVSPANCSIGGSTEALSSEPHPELPSLYQSQVLNDSEFASSPPATVVQHPAAQTCSICGFTTRNLYRSSLVEHMRIHEAPTQCERCGKVLAPRSLVRHVEKCVPNALPRRVCTMCGKSYASVQILARHTRKVHSTL